MSEEECHEQRGNVSSVHIGIGHDDYLMIAQFAQIKRFAVLFGTDKHAERRIDIFNFFAFEHFVLHGFFHVQNFSPQR